MKGSFKRIAAALMLGAALTSVSVDALAQGRGRDRDGPRGPGRYEQVQRGREYRGREGSGRYEQVQRDRQYRGQEGSGRYRQVERDRDIRAGRRAPMEPVPVVPVAPGGWRRGQYLPPAYRGAVVPDIGRYRLRPPPPGYDWVGVGPDVYLVQRNSGLVLDAVPGGF